MTRGIIDIIIGLVLVIGGLSGKLVFIGTQSGPLLAVLGLGLVGWGGYRIWKDEKKE